MERTSAIAGVRKASTAKPRPGTGSRAPSAVASLTAATINLKRLAAALLALLLRWIVRGSTFAAPRTASANGYGGYFFNDPVVHWYRSIFSHVPRSRCGRSRPCSRRPASEPRRRAGGSGGRGDTHLLPFPGGALAADSHQQTRSSASCARSGGARVSCLAAARLRYIAGTAWSTKPIAHVAHLAGPTAFEHDAVEINIRVLAFLFRSDTVEGDSRVPHKASVMSSTRRTDTRPIYSRRAALRSYRCALHNRSASASSKAFSVSSTVPRTTRSRWLLIRW